MNFETARVHFLKDVFPTVLDVVVAYGSQLS